MAASGLPKRINFDDALKFITNGDQSDIDDLSSDEEMDSDDIGFEPDNDEEGLDENIEEENDQTAEDSIAPAIPPSPSKQHVFRWRKKDIPITHGNFTMHQQENVAVKSPVEYFKLFWTDELNELIADQTNLYSTQKKAPL